MAHRIYIYNIDKRSGDTYPHYLGEWNYVIPPLLLPLFSANLYADKKVLYADKTQGISNLRRFYDLLAEVYQLTYKNNFKIPTEKMFKFLDNLPYDTFAINAADVFNMNEESHSQQAKDWVEDIKEQAQFFEKAIDSRSLEVLNDYLTSFGYTSYLEALQTDWIDYGLGYWNEDAFSEDGVEIFEEGGVQGIRDAKRNIILTPQYEEIYAFTNNMAVAKRNNTYGYINTKGEEILATQFDEASDPFLIYYGVTHNQDQEYQTWVGLVEQQNKQGLIDLESKSWLIPCIYEHLETVYGNLFNAVLEGLYYLVDHQNNLVVAEGSENKFEWNNEKLYFTKIKGTSKRKYFSHTGLYLGEYIEDSIENLPLDHFYVRPSRFIKKIQILNPDSNILDTDIDKIITIDNYETVAYKKNNNWIIYNLQQQNNVDFSTLITNVIVGDFTTYYPDWYVLQTNEGMGLFDAKKAIWLIPIDQSTQHIFLIESELFCIQKSSGFSYWNAKSKEISYTYDYISESPDLDRYKILLFHEDTLYALSIEHQLIKVAHEDMGNLYQRRHNLRGKDSQYFNSFYSKWKNHIGANYYHYYDNNSLYEVVTEYLRDNKIDQALPLLELGVQRGDHRMMYDLASIYSDENKELYFNLSKAITLYTKASKLGNALAWNDLGYHFQNGIGCDRDITKAMTHYENAGQLGNGLGYANLGDLYFYGEWVEQDYDKALSYYKKAQKLYCFNDRQLTEIYYQKEEFNKVLSLLKKDIEETYSPIYYGILYENGFGIKQNVNKAIKYYEKALGIAIYDHAVQRLLYYYQQKSPYENINRFQELLDIASENQIEINKKEIGLS